MRIPELCKRADFLAAVAGALCFPLMLAIGLALGSSAGKRKAAVVADKLAATSDELAAVTKQNVALLTQIDSATRVSKPVSVGDASSQTEHPDRAELAFSLQHAIDSVGTEFAVRPNLADETTAMYQVAGGKVFLVPRRIGQGLVEISVLGSVPDIREFARTFFLILQFTEPYKAEEAERLGTWFNDSIVFAASNPESFVRRAFGRHLVSISYFELDKTRMVLVSFLPGNA